MAFDYKRLTAVQYIPAAVAAIFTNPASAKTYVKTIIIHNTDTVAETVSLYSVLDNAGAVGTASLANRFYSESLPAGDTRIIEIPTPGLILLNTNETIQAVTTTASKVTIQITGGQE